ncbi:hydroxychlorobactene glucosyltransferase CruC [soil metagenome]
MAEPVTLFWLNSFSLIFLLITSVILLRNRIEFTSLRSYDNPAAAPLKISVCIPARNEELIIARVLTSVCEQDYPDFELLVLDDYSTDRTPELIESVQHTYPNLITNVPASEKPTDWLGKPWACQQLADRATGDLILFADADTRFYPDMLQQIANAFHEYQLDVITVWPQQEMKSFWEKMIVPLIYYALLTLLPAVYVYRPPRWLPANLRKKITPQFAAACGQCIGFRSDAYHRIGGHEPVKDCVVEDVELAKHAKIKGLTLRMFNGIGSISCRMYRSEQEIFNGLRKNFFAGFRRSVSLFVTMAVLHLIVFVLPFILLPYSLYFGYPILVFLSITSITIIYLHRYILARWFNWDPVYGCLHPLAVLWFQRLALVSLVDYFSGRKVKWKDREI